MEKEMATHSSILAWRIPWTEEPGGLQSMGSQESHMTECLSLHFTGGGLFPDDFLGSFWATWTPQVRNYLIYMMILPKVSSMKH